MVIYKIVGRHGEVTKVVLQIYVWSICQLGLWDPQEGAEQFISGQLKRSMWPEYCLREHYLATAGGFFTGQPCGAPVIELSREHGMSSATFTSGEPTFGGMDASMLARLKNLKSENRPLKKMHAEKQLKADIFKQTIETNGETVSP